MTAKAKGASLSAIVLAFLTAPPDVGRANDTLAQLSAGGLVLTRTDDIEMRSEDLYLSEDLVRVKYRFFNASAHDVTSTVAFPMPDIVARGEEMEPSILSEDSRNLLGFLTEVDGPAVHAKVEQAAIKDGVDRSELLGALGVPLAPHLAATAERLAHLPAADRAKLLRLGLVRDAGARGPEDPGAHDLFPAWTLRTRFYWTQTFPAKQEIVIEHRYRPAVGGAMSSRWGDPAWPANPGFTAARALYCVDDAFLAAAARRGTAASETTIGYVLTTGANWKKPIGAFRLVVDKGEAGNLVSFCGEGVRPIGPSLFEMTRRDFTPGKVLDVLILEAPRAD